MIKIAFCDNDYNVLNHLEGIMVENKMMADCDYFGSGKILLDYINANNEAFNIYLLDIEMPELNGINTAQNIRDKDKNAVIIFLTDYKEYVYQVFEVLPFRFLQKPVEQDKLIQTINEAIDHIHKNQTLFFFQIGHEQMQMPFGEIIYFEGAGRRVVLRTAKESLLFYGGLNEIWRQLDKQLFTRPHASFLVNMEFIRSVRQNEVIVANDIAIPISKRFRSQLKWDHMMFVERRNGIK